jgi:GTP diphosphokinase / guanosine-3',5'-bis(diphosphate) 3'-diphosphatase
VGYSIGSARSVARCGEIMSDALDLMRAIDLANSFFYGKLDKNGAPLVLHSMRVMMAGTTPDEQVVGMLHDVLEDTHVTEHVLEQHQFERHIIEAVLTLTHHAGEPYDAYIHRVSMTELARSVKIRDLQDNMARSPPLHETPETSNARKRKYKFWLEYLTS